MKISAKGRYAVRSVINLSKSRGTNRSVREIATEEEISPDFLEKIFSKLKKNGIITSTRGAYGGFSLKKEPEDITILSILKAINEDLTPTPCASEKCGKECDISYFWTMTKVHVSTFFNRVTIADIINRKITL